MSNITYTIREIQLTDNRETASIIRKVLIEFGVPKLGTAYEDIALDTMFETYNTTDAAYFVITDGKNILGGAGIMKLPNCEEHICELQKMYFSPKVRNKGLGAKMMKICLDKARSFGYKKCYLETLPYMKEARLLYEKEGFEPLKAPLGNTGHYSCTMWMLKKL